MLEMLRELVAHKGHANAAFLGAIRESADAAADPELRELLHHILIANRFWLLTIVGAPFVRADESRPFASFDALVQQYAVTHEQESAWLDAATNADIGRVLEGSLIPGDSCSVGQALMQVCLHSHAHRAQGAKLLRRHGLVAPQADYILWLRTRPSPDWRLPA